LNISLWLRHLFTNLEHTERLLTTKLNDRRNRIILLLPLAMIVSAFSLAIFITLQAVCLLACLVGRLLFVGVALADIIRLNCIKSIRNGIRNGSIKGCPCDAFYFVGGQATSALLVVSFIFRAGIQEVRSTTEAPSCTPTPWRWYPCTVFNTLAFTFEVASTKLLGSGCNLSCCNEAENNCCASDGFHSLMSDDWVSRSEQLLNGRS